ncbi:hypothetical protein Tco_1038156, partial [Tanacetum coccineum]
TASPEVNTGRFKLNIVDPSVNTASSYELDSPQDMFKLGVSHTLEITHVEFFSNEDEPKVDLGNITNSYTIPTTPNTRIHKDHQIKNVIGDKAIRKNFCNSNFKRLDHLLILSIGRGTLAQNGSSERGIVIRINASWLHWVIDKKKVFRVYVDDIIFGSTNKELCTAFEKLMKDKFQMSSVGELTSF